MKLGTIRLRQHVIPDIPLRHHLIRNLCSNYVLSTGAVIDAKHLTCLRMGWKYLTYLLSISVASIIAYDQLMADVYETTEFSFKEWYF